MVRDSGRGSDSAVALLAAFDLRGNDSTEVASMLDIDLHGMPRSGGQRATAELART